MLNEKIEDGEKILKEKCYVHPKRDPNIFSNDLAIIKLARDIIFSEKVKPICIGDPSHKITAGGQVSCFESIQVFSISDWKVLAAGWGQEREKGGGSVTLKYVWLDVISPGECEDRIQDAVDTQPGFKGRFTSNTLCTWEAGEDTCGGDSGGPLVTRGGGGSLELVGLTSWGPRSCAHSEVPPGRLHACYFRPPPGLFEM